MNTKKRRIALVAFIAVACAAVLAIILLIRPSCIILKLTGFYCPACGTQRMLLSLLHGDFSAAIGYNPFMLCVLTMAAVYAVCEALRFINKKPLLCKSKGFELTLIIILIAAIIFAVLRNTAAFGFLAP